MVQCSICMSSRLPRTLIPHTSTNSLRGVAFRRLNASDFPSHCESTESHMGVRGRYTPVDILKRIEKLARLRKSEVEIAKLCGVSRPTVRKYRPADVEANSPGRPAGN